LLTKFLDSRRLSTSPKTIEFYQSCFKPFAKNYELTSDGISSFLADLKCGNAKHAYFRAIRAFTNWLVRNDYLKQNPLKKIDPPKLSKPILPSLTTEQVNYLIDRVDTLRDKTIISLLVSITTIFDPPMTTYFDPPG
jgi:site-specific recombinase XerD